MTDRSDATLVEAARVGDKAAFGDLVDRHLVAARRTAMQIVRDYESACELTQEAILQAYLGLQTLQDPARFAAWFQGIVRNVCRTYLRQQRFRVTSLDAVDEGALDQAQHTIGTVLDPVRQLEAQEESDVVHAAIAALSPKNQAATWLFYMESMSIEEIAQTLDASPNAIKGRLFQARKQLRDQLTPLFAPMMGTTKVRTRIYKKEQTMSQTSIVKVMQSASTGNQILYLLDIEGHRYLKIWIGQHEAEQIRMQLEGKSTARPLTYRYFADFLQAMDIQLESVRVERLHETTFYAVSQFRNGDLIKELDARPSDAIGLALYAGSPIFVDDELMAQAGESLPDPFDVDAWFGTEVERIHEERHLLAAWQAEFFKTFESHFTQQAKSALQNAIGFVQHFRHNYLGTEHLLWGLVTNQDGFATKLLHDAGVTRATLTQAAMARLGPLPEMGEQAEIPSGVGDLSGLMPQLVPRVREVLQLSDTIRAEHKADRINTEHLLLGILREGGGMAVTLLQDLAVDLVALEHRTLTVVAGDSQRLALTKLSI